MFQLHCLGNDNIDQTLVMVLEAFTRACDTGKEVYVIVRTTDEPVIDDEAFLNQVPEA